MKCCISYEGMKGQHCRQVISAAVCFGVFGALQPLGGTNELICEQK